MAPGVVELDLCNVSILNGFQAMEDREIACRIFYAFLSKILSRGKVSLAEGRNFAKRVSEDPDLILGLVRVAEDDILKDRFSKTAKKGARAQATP